MGTPAEVLKRATPFKDRYGDNWRREAGRMGGRKVAEQRGPEFFEHIGRKGALRVLELYGPRFLKKPKEEVKTAKIVQIHPVREAQTDTEEILDSMDIMAIRSTDSRLEKVEWCLWHEEDHPPKVGENQRLFPTICPPCAQKELEKVKNPVMSVNLPC